MGTISDSVRHYIVAKTVVSALTGALVYALLRAIGLDLAETWALLTVFLNFMFLAAPITVVAMIVCAHVPPLRPIAVLLSADSPERSHRRIGGRVGRRRPDPHAGEP